MRDGAITLFHVRGIPVRAHWTLFLILAYLTLVLSTQFPAVAALAGETAADVSLPPVLIGLFLAVGLFASVAVHEVAHSLLATRFGGRVRAITLMMLGGISQIERMPRRPGTEALVAAIGPFTSLALAVALLLFHGVLGGAPADARIAVFYLAQANLLLGIFNLLPAFPLDGGRVLRALLSIRLHPTRATAIAAGVGKAGAIVLALLGFWGGNFLLILIGVFLYVGAGAEAASERARGALAGLRVGDLMIARPPIDGLDTTLADALARMHGSGWPELILVDGRGAPIGVLRASDVVQVPAEQRPLVRVRDLRSWAARKVSTIPVDDPADRLLERDPRSYVIVVESPPSEPAAIVGLIGPGELARSVELLAIDESRQAPRAEKRRTA